MVAVLIIFYFITKAKENIKHLSKTYKLHIGMMESDVYFGIRRGHILIAWPKLCLFQML